MKIDLSTFLSFAFMACSISILIFTFFYYRKESKQIDKKMKELEKIATIDNLTGLYNRYALEIRFSEEINRAIHEKKSLTILYIDLDNFKLVNDRYGHAAGDKVLQIIAKIIAKNKRLSDIAGELFVGRHGGDEFMILISNINLSTAYEKAEEIIKKINQVKYKDVTLGASIGVHELSKFESLEDLKNNADAALRIAKKGGKNQVKII